MKIKTLTLKQIKKNELKILQCKNNKEIAKLLNVSTKSIVLHAFKPLYYHFKIPKKKKNEFRQIEAPSLELKKLQRKLNYFLQSVYYVHQSKASYGYIIKAINQKKAKNIYTNALQHLGNKYLLNADFKDFFHQITITDVTNIFKSNYFNLDNYTAHTLAKICCYKDRLPMGAPTSPVLSNLFAIQLDNQLSKWAINNNITYTRFVDDLSFSSKNNSITPNHFAQISDIALIPFMNQNTL